MTEENILTKEEKQSSSLYQHEDAVMKSVMQFFANELLPYLGIHDKVVGIAPTESTVLELHKFFQDSNLIMEDGSWKHFEFQSSSKGIKDLKRFRSYEAVTSYQYEVSVTTYVLFSGKVKNPVTEFTEGINTYRVVPIIMADWNADELLKNLKYKIDKDEKITKEDLVQLALTPLMGGESEQKERITEAFGIMEKTKNVPEADIQRLEAAVYAMADKFLKKDDMEQLRGNIRMTTLARMFFQDGWEEGAQDTKIESARNLLGILSDELIAEKIGLPLETVLQLKAEKENPDQKEA